MGRFLPRQVRQSDKLGLWRACGRFGQAGTPSVREKIAASPRAVCGVPPALRNLVRETQLSVHDFVLPAFL